MGNRVRIIETEQLRLQWDFGTYALMMYYAKQLNEAKGEKLFFATVSEDDYNFEKGIWPTNTIIDEYTVRFNVSELNEAIDFVTLEMIPALLAEQTDLIEKYGGETRFYELYEAETGYLSAIGLDDGNEYTYSDPEYIVWMMEGFIKLAKEALVSGKPYKAYVD